MRPAAEPTRAPVGVAVGAWFCAFAASVAAVQLVFASPGAVMEGAVAVSGTKGAATTFVPFATTALSVLVQWVPTLVALWYVSSKFMTGSWPADYGLRFRWRDLAGIPIGILSQLVLLELLYWPLRTLFEGTFARSELEKPARELTDRADGAWKIVLVLLVVVGAPLVEELLYRGLVLRSLDARYADLLALGISAVWFALAHFQPVQFLGLCAFGIVLGTALQRTGRLGMGILAHAAFNATSVALLWR